MKNYYKKETCVINNDTWIIHYHRLDETTVKITYDLLRPHRKFWQSKEIFSDWTYWTLRNPKSFEAFADHSIITDYYERKKQIEKIDKFFEKTH